MKSLIILCVFLFAGVFSLQAQKHTISGYVRDRATGEDLIGATIYSPSHQVGVATNNFGFYSISFPEKDTVTLIYSYVGFSSVRKFVSMDSSQHINIDIASSIELAGVDIIGKKEKIQESTNMSSVDLPIDQIKQLPAIAGETDVIKAIQLLPGVQSGSEGSSGMYVRGGGPDQNLILLDGVPVYNVTHLFGFFSVFNSDAIKNVELIKGGYPARYAGRISSVMEINMKEGNMKKFRAEGTIGMISSKLMVEGPIWKDKTSFIVSGRRTYIDLLAGPIIRAANKEEQEPGVKTSTSLGYYFYDLNLKLNHKFSDKDRLFLSTYSGDDNMYSKFSYEEGNVAAGELDAFSDLSDDQLKWGNRIAALRWNHKFSNQLFSNLNLTYSDYKFGIGSESLTQQVLDTATVSYKYENRFTSGITDYAVRLNFDFIPKNNKHYIKFGVHGIEHRFTPRSGLISMEIPGIQLDSSFGGTNITSREAVGFIEDDIKITKRLKANIGFNASMTMLDSVTYNSFEPRVAARYLLNNDWAVKASYAKMSQYLHLLTNSSVGLPSDLWVPVTNNIKPQRSQQYAFGIAKTIKEDYLVSFEGYYRTMTGLIAYKPGASFFDLNSDWEDMVTEGIGRSYGAEVFIHKKFGDLTGWIGYTWSKTDRKFDELNFGEWFPYKFDRRHDISVVLFKKLSDKWDVSGTWVYGTGNAITLPTVRYSAYSNDSWSDIHYFQNKNDYRMAPYHRMDIGFKRTKKRKWGEGVMTYGVYNVYSRRNPFYYFFSWESTDGNVQRVLKRVSLFPILPSISWTFKIY